MWARTALFLPTRPSSRFPCAELVKTLPMGWKPPAVGAGAGGIEEFWLHGAGLDRATFCSWPASPPETSGDATEPGGSPCRQGARQGLSPYGSVHTALERAGKQCWGTRGVRLPGSRCKVQPPCACPSHPRAQKPRWTLWCRGWCGCGGMKPRRRLVGVGGRNQSCSWPMWDSDLGTATARGGVPGSADPDHGPR